MMKRKTICLNMIVKDESHVIRGTLEKLCSQIKFDYWVICDTGSTDGTQDIIKGFFQEKGIEGELLQHEWKNFGHNRTLALEGAYQKADYLFIFDADDSIHGEFKVPAMLDADIYMLKFGEGLTYLRPLLMNARKRSRFVGVLHEYFTFIEPAGQSKTIEGNYFIDSGKTGSRSRDANKYLKDAKILEQAYEEEKTKDVNLANRYAFYCAQSYKDCNQVDKAIEWYSLVADKLYSWTQEKYYSCLMAGQLYRRKGDNDKALEYFLKADRFDNERKEGVIFAIDILREKGLHPLVVSLYEQHKNYNKDPQDKLFLFRDMFNDMLEFNASISAYLCENKKLAYECLKKIILNNIANPQIIFASINNLGSHPHEANGDKDSLALFYRLTDLLQTYENFKPLVVIWNILLKNNKPSLTRYSPIPRKNKKVEVFLSITSCKRLDLFQETINSILNHWTDVDMVDYWFCVDDNSSEEDRKFMKSKYSWFHYYMKTPEEKGHRESMNIIWNKLKELKPKYWIHLEDDFLFYVKRSYVEDSINFLKTQTNIKQVLFNRSYAETMEQLELKGTQPVSPGFVVHEYKNGDFPYPNCHYWPHYSFRPSVVCAKTILELGNFDSPNQFFERDYADRWTAHGYKSAFFDMITCKHTGRLTSDKDTKTVKNAYDLNNETQFNSIKEHPNKVVNLKRRPDRRNKVEEEFKKHNFSKYSFVEGVDGYQLKPTLEIKKLFEGNDFAYRCGFIGCALSHYILWQKLLADTENEYYVIFEDDITLASNFETKFKELEKDFRKFDYLLLGYHMTSKNRELLHEKYNVETDNIQISTLDRNIYIGGTFAYSINKKGAKKLLEYIQVNKIQNGIDYLIGKRCPNLDLWELRPQIVFSEWYEQMDQNVDTDIQKSYQCLDISNIKDPLDEFEFYRGLDHHGDDITHMRGTLESVLETAAANPECVAVNTLGFFKNKVDISNLKPSPYFSDHDGIFIRVKSKKTVKFTNLGISSEQLAKEFDRFPHPDFDLTWKNEADYYVVMNIPDFHEYYDPKKTIVFQGEPWVYDESKHWGVKMWREWAEPDESKFLKVFSIKKHLNLALWDVDVTSKELPSKKDELAFVCSKKITDTGHILRRDLALKLGDKIKVYGKENYHNFSNYCGGVPEEQRYNVYAFNKYTLAVENNKEDYYATEKIWEPILCESLPFYWGCPNLEDFIPADSFVRIPLEDPEECERIIDQAIKEDWWSQRIDNIREAKKIIMNELGMMRVISKTINESLDQTKPYRIKANIITLERNNQRNQNVETLKKQLLDSNIDTEVVYGVDGQLIEMNGSSITYKGTTKKYDRTKRHSRELMTKGEFGCAWSHINVYEKLVNDEEHDAYLILEDDSVFLENLDFLNQLPPSFDVCQLTKSICYPYKKTTKVNKTFYNVVRRYFNCTAGYIITKECAQKLLDHLDGHINIPSDDLLSNSFIDRIINVIVPENPLVGYKSEIKSSIW